MLYLSIRKHNSSVSDIVKLLLHNNCANYVGGGWTVGRTANYRIKINGLIDRIETNLENLGEYDEGLNKIWLTPDEEEKNLNYEYSLNNLER